MMAADHIDNYCERLDIGLWAEPINAITNIAFLIAAFMLFRYYRKHKMHDMQAAILISLIAIIGSGSFLFHTIADHTSMLADIIPITVFVFMYLWVALRRLLGLNRLYTAFSLVILLVAAIAAENAPAAYSFNGSIAYFPCLAALLIIGIILSYRRHPAARSMYNASMLFILSLTFRSIDMAVCENFTLGTHFLWHMCNGAVLYVLTRPLINPLA